MGRTSVLLPALHSYVLNSLDLQQHAHADGTLGAATQIFQETSRTHQSCELGSIATPSPALENHNHHRRSQGAHHSEMWSEIGKEGGG